MSDVEDYPWTLKVIFEINRLTPNVKGKSFSADWFLLRQMLEQMEDRVKAAEEAAQRWQRS